VVKFKGMKIKYYLFIFIGILIIGSAIGIGIPKYKKISERNKKEAVMRKAYDFSKENISKILKCPSTAIYPSFNEKFIKLSGSLTKSYISIHSYVDAQNSFGAMMRNKYTIYIDGNNDVFKIDNLIFNGEVLMVDGKEINYSEVDN